ncbi:hypothetical protein J6590_076112 [Homalodisca vitripennis]|nr:hypothetical protein J6590_076112 [Homalodisca vitripennis]
MWQNSPSARWGLRPQAPFWVLAKFGNKKDLVIGQIRTLCNARKFPGGGLAIPGVKTSGGDLVIPGNPRGVKRFSDL